MVALAALPWEVIGVGIAALLAGLLKSLRNGRLRREVDNWERKQETAEEAHEAIPEVLEKLEHMERKQDQGFAHVRRRIDEVGRTVYLLHSREDEEPHDDELRDRLGVDASDDDLFRGGGTATTAEEDD